MVTTRFVSLDGQGGTLWYLAHPQDDCQVASHKGHVSTYSHHPLTSSIASHPSMTPELNPKKKATLGSITLLRRRKLWAKLRVKSVITGKSAEVITYVDKMAQTDLLTLAG